MSFFIPFAYGLLVGSFLNVCIFRLPRGTSIVSPRSTCPVCKEPITWWQNIPLLSYLFLLGRCARCGSPISPRYALIEAVTGLLFIFVWNENKPLFLQPHASLWEWLFRAALPFLCQLAFACLLLVITVIDWDYQIIVDATTAWGAGIGLLYSAVLGKLWWALLALACAALFFYGVRVLGEFVYLKEAMGEGDVKLAGMLGAFLGPKGVALATFLSFPIGLFMALFLIAARLRSRKDYIPFGPAMALGGFVAMFWGERLLEWYLGSLLPLG